MYMFCLVYTFAYAIFILETSFVYMKNRIYFPPEEEGWQHNSHEARRELEYNSIREKCIEID